MTSITSTASPPTKTKTKVDKIKNKKNNPRISDVDIHDFHISLAKEIVNLQSQPQTQSIPSSSQPPIIDQGADTTPSRPKVKARKRKSPIVIEPLPTELPPEIEQPILPPSSPSPIPQPSTSTMKEPRVRSRKSFPTTSTSTSTVPPVLPQAVISEADVHLFHLLHLHPSTSTSAPLPTSNLKIKKRRQSEPNPTTSRSRKAKRKLPIFSHPRAVLYRRPEGDNGGRDRRRIVLSESQEYQVPPLPRSEKERKGKAKGEEQKEKRKPSFVFWDDKNDYYDEDDDEHDYTALVHGNGAEDQEDEEEEVEDGPLFPSQSALNSPDNTQSTPTHQKTIPQSQSLSQGSSNYDQLLPSSPIVAFSSPTRLATKTKKRDKKEKTVEKEKEKEKKKEKKENNKKKDGSQADNHNSQFTLATNQTPALTQQTSTPVQNEKNSKRPRESVDGSRKKKKGPKWVTQTPTQESVQG